MSSRLPPVTLGLIIANVVAFMIQQVAGQYMVAWFALWPWGPVQAVQTSHGVVMVGFHLWQLVTYGFLHGGIAHIFFNMFGLFMFGATIEYTFGRNRFLLYYFVCLVTAALTHLLVVHFATDNFYPTIGASGAVFGVLLAFGMLFPHQRVVLLIPPIPMPAWLFVTGYGVLELVLGVTGTASGIAHFAHLGGMLGGIMLILYWRGKLILKPRRLLLR